MKDVYEIWRTNRFDNDIPVECVGRLYDLELAKDFVDHQATMGESFVIIRDGNKIDTE